MRLSPVAWLTAGGMLLAWFFLWQKLSVDWSVNDQYQYGWFVPPLALALFALRWRDRPAAKSDASPVILSIAAGFALLLLAPLRLVEEPNADWRILFWLHAVALTLLSLALAGWAGGRPWLKHFAFPILFLLLAVPWPSGPEQALIQHLMRSVAAVAAEGLNLLGIPAIPQGNLIRVREQVVGVNEACSGIRSLQTVLMGALMLGELSRFTWPRRLGLLAGGITVAMAANVFRSGLLVWIAAKSGVAALERYHDAAGMTVLLIVFGGLLGLSKVFEPRRKLERAEVPPTAVSRGRPLPLAVAVSALTWLVVVEISIAGWYYAHERRRVWLPTWTIAQPTEAPNFHALPIDDVTRAMLRYDTAQSGRWRRPGFTGPACSMYFFRWEPGRTSATLATMHQPTVCLPASGLTQVGPAAKRMFPTPIGIDLPVEQYEFTFKGQRLYVFYVVWQDRTGYELAGEQVSVAHRLRVALEGQRNLGQQTLELVLTGPADADEAASAFSRELSGIVRRKG